MMKNLSNYSLSTKKSRLGYQGKNLKYQRSSKEVTIDLPHLFDSLFFLDPQRLRPSLSTTLLLPVSLYLSSVSQNSYNVDQLIISYAL